MGVAITEVLILGVTLMPQDSAVSNFAIARNNSCHSTLAIDQTFENWRNVFAKKPHRSVLQDVVMLLT